MDRLGITEKSRLAQETAVMPRVQEAAVMPMLEC